MYKSNMEQDILKVAVFERHKRTGTVGRGFVKGFGIKLFKKFSK